VVAKFRESFAASKERVRKFVGKRFNLNQLIKPQVKEQYQFEISNRFAALEN